MDLNRGIRLVISQYPRFMGKAPTNFCRGEISRPPPYGNRVSPRVVAVGESTPFMGEISWGRGSRGSKSFHIPTKRMCRFHLLLLVGV
jgi:hypothetical protein